MSKVFDGVIWRTLQQYGGYIVKLVVQTVLARILMPEEYGIVAQTLAFISIAEILATGGLGTALIQHKNPQKIDYATSLCMSMILSALFYILLFLTAPLISAFYESEQMTIILRVYGMAIFINSYASIQNAYIMKAFEMKKSFFASLISIVVSGIVAIIMAVNGCGVWAIVAQSIIASMVSIIALHFTVAWKPTFGFDWERCKSLFSFSWKVALSSLLGSVLENMYNLTIGKIYGKETLGYYNRGNSFPSALVGQLRTAISTVTLPAYAEQQDDKEKLLMSIKKTTHMSVIVIFPLACWLAFSAESFITVLLTEKWLPCIFFLRLECVFYGTLPIAASIGNGLTAIGRSDIAMKAETIKLLSTILCVLGLSKFDVRVMCIARVTIAVLIIFYYISSSRKLIGYHVRLLIEDIKTPLIISLVVGLLAFSVSLLGLPPLVTLLCQTLVMFGAYIVGALMFMSGDCKEIVMLIKAKMARK